MQLTWFSVVVIASFVASAVRAAPNVKEACGTDGEVISTNTFVHNEKEYSVTTRSCPGFASLRGNVTDTQSIAGRAAMPKQKRQLVNCNIDCSVECEDIADQATENACYVLSEAVQAQDPDYFIAPAQTLTTFSDGGECEYGYANLDVVEYEVCYEDIGNNGLRVAALCFDLDGIISTGGYCVSPEVADNDWILEVFYD
ncbi:uncharacterized protein FIBRA_08879 [Fibroporia radiculosa]|uniref:Uncharacterized protein n=1 Tax=Fibroporia radiculosa TaxID=599839 RepID=J4GXK0_9APHY|nr:uncharacterized protein FIBRA_08879 [Fibroporia radiculosa]CCM06600.1 predicted protein [Fibroporia radiculosa]